MNAYIGIGAARIQTWLLRTPNLAGMRGASKALAAATKNETVRVWLQQRNLRAVSIEQDAGDVDGVVVVTAPHADAHTVARELLAHLSGEVPGIEWEAWWCPADSYLTAYTLAAADDERVERLTWLPTTQDIPVLRSCECRREPSGVDERTWPGGEKRFSGADCARRHAHHHQVRRSALGSGGATRSPGSSGGQLWDQIPGRAPDDLSELARLGGLREGTARLAHGRKDSRNHTATVVADGNAMGALFDLIAERSKVIDLGGFRTLAVESLNSIAIHAVLAAAARITPPNLEQGGEPTHQEPAPLMPVMAVLPHFVGGDDMFVSVPAPLAWEFVTELARAFEGLRTTLNHALDGLSTSGVDLPDLRQAVQHVSLGVGVCFSRASHPIAETHAAAERAMLVAKKSGAGASSFIGWTDLTEGAVTVVSASGSPERRVIGLEEALAQLGPGTQPDVFDLTPSARAMLASILRDVEPSVRDSKVDQWAARVGWTRSSTIEDLPALLSRARWWPGARHTEQNSPSPRESRPGMPAQPPTGPATPTPAAVAS